MGSGRRGTWGGGAITRFDVTLNRKTPAPRASNASARPNYCKRSRPGVLIYLGSPHRYRPDSSQTNMLLPALVLISGAPGTGKTTMGRHLATGLRIPYLGKDLIKESLFDSLGTKDREWSVKLGIASIEKLEGSANVLKSCLRCLAAANSRRREVVL